MLRTREPITLRSLVAGTGVSTMAVYTYFGGMDGVWRALRQEGFTRLAARFAAVAESGDPVRDLAALAAAYVRHALEYPDLYRVMFDAAFDLDDPQAADDTLERMVAAAAQAKAVGRLRADVVSLETAVQTWVLSHGLVSLVATGPMPRTTLDLGPSMLTALLVGAGEDEQRCRASVERGWRTGSVGHP